VLVLRAGYAIGAAAKLFILILDKFSACVFKIFQQCGVFFVHVILQVLDVILSDDGFQLPLMP
jgi:hypothetical protein